MCVHSKVIPKKYIPWREPMSMEPAMTWTFKSYVIWLDYHTLGSVTRHGTLLFRNSSEGALPAIRINTQSVWVTNSFGGLVWPSRWQTCGADYDSADHQHDIQRVGAPLHRSLTLNFEDPFADSDPFVDPVAASHPPSPLAKHWGPLFDWVLHDVAVLLFEMGVIRDCDWRGRMRKQEEERTRAEHGLSKWMD